MVVGDFDSLIDMNQKFSSLHFILAIPVFTEIFIVTLCYYKRVNNPDAAKQESEFYRCRGNMWNINIILTLSVIDIDTSFNFYQLPIRMLSIVMSRLISTILASFFLNLLRSSKLTISQYIFIRFNNIRYLIIVDLVTLILLFKSLARSIASLERFTDAVKLTASVQCLIWYLYSLILILVGGMRGWLWVASFRYIIIFTCEVAILTFILFFGSRHYFLTNIDSDAFLTASKNKKAINVDSLNWVMSFVYNLSYNLSLMILTDYSKYISCNKKGKNSSWSMILHVIPFSIVIFCEGLTYILVYINYRKKKCDPVGKADVARGLLLYEFIEEISATQPNHILHFIIGLKSFILGLNTMPAIILTFYEKLLFILSKIDTFKLPKQREKFYVGHMIISISVVFISVYTLLKDQSKINYWLTQTINIAISVSSLLATAVIFSSAMIPQMNPSIFNFIPFFTFLITLSDRQLAEVSKKKGGFGQPYEDFCNYFTYCGLRRSVSQCAHPCQDTGSGDYFVSLTFLNGFLITFGFSLFITTIGKLSLKHLNPTIFIPCMFSFWQRRYANSLPQTKSFRITERPVA